MHTFWLAFLVPAVILSQWVWPILKQRSIWTVIGIVVATATVVWLLMGLSTLGGNQVNVQELLKMFAFRIVSSTDLPFIQLLIASGVGWFGSVWAPSLSRGHMSEAVEPKVDQPIATT